ncbi:hypothetical protein KY285_008845 [Solanum tuberosum]|nr:hypothetical protein KY285_008845 [Solanum tuberosum]
MLKNSMNLALLLLIQLLLIAIAVQYSTADESFDVRQHLSTVSRYGIVKDISDDSFAPSQNLDQCTPIHLNLVESDRWKNLVLPLLECEPQFAGLQSSSSTTRPSSLGAKQSENLNSVEIWTMLYDGKVAEGIP